MDRIQQSIGTFRWSSRVPRGGFNTLMGVLLFLTGFLVFLTGLDILALQGRKRLMEMERRTTG